MNDQGQGTPNIPRHVGLEQGMERLQVEPRRVLVTPDANTQRPFDILGRPPADPIPFIGRPRIHSGRRDKVLCYNPNDGKHEQLENVLFRDFGNGDDNEVRIAYYPTPFKAPIRTIMGHVEICVVLERCKREKDDTDDDLSNDSSSSDEEDEEIVFQFTERKVAVKVNSMATMERLRGRHAEDPIKEIECMQLIGTTNPNVLGCVEVLFDRQNLNVVMEFCDSGDLFQLLQDTQSMNANVPNAPPGLSEGQARYWFRQIIHGVQYLHESCGICHRDLSPENVMIDQNRRGLVIDMGMCLRVPHQEIQIEGSNGSNTSRVLRVTDLQTARRHNSIPFDEIRRIDQPQLVRRRCLFKPQGTCGKMPYMAPEIYRNRDPFDGEAADIWTSGTILFCMVTGNRSYQRPHLSDPQFYWMTMGLEQMLADWNVRLSEEGLHLLKNMLQVDPRIRLTLQEVLNHPWFMYPDEEPVQLFPDDGLEFNLDDD